jgi:hypothetical protein
MLYCGGMAMSIYHPGDSVIVKGIVICGDSLKIVPSVHIYNSKMQGMVADEKGSFAFKARKGDAFWFSAMGYEKYVYVIPENKQEINTIVVYLQRASYTIGEVDVFEWSTPEEFKEAFITNKPTHEEIVACENVKVAVGIARELGPMSSLDMQLSNQIHANHSYRGIVQGYFIPVRIAFYRLFKKKKKKK